MYDTETYCDYCDKLIGWFCDWTKDKICPSCKEKLKLNREMNI